MKTNTERRYESPQTNVVYFCCESCITASASDDNLDANNPAGWDAGNDNWWNL